MPVICSSMPVIVCVKLAQLCLHRAVKFHVGEHKPAFGSYKCEYGGGARNFFVAGCKCVNLLQHLVQSEECTAFDIINIGHAAVVYAVSVVCSICAISPLLLRGQSMPAQQRRPSTRATARLCFFYSCAAGPLASADVAVFSIPATLHFSRRPNATGGHRMKKKKTPVQEPPSVCIPLIHMWHDSSDLYRLAQQTHAAKCLKPVDPSGGKTLQTSTGLRSRFATASVLARRAHSTQTQPSRRILPFSLLQIHKRGRRGGK